MTGADSPAAYSGIYPVAYSQLGRPDAGPAGRCWFLGQKRAGVSRKLVIRVWA